MSDIAVSGPAPIFTCEITEIRSFLAGTGGITAGQSFYTDPTTGTQLPTTSLTSGKYQSRGISLDTVGAGQAFDGVEKGYLNGFDVSALAFDALVYVSDTAGKLATAAGTNSSVVGRVAAMTDRDSASNKPSKVLYFRPSVI